jgi:hypothetical protein
MANELQILPNPDNVPGAVSSGYQRQNTNFFASAVGLDLLNFSKNYPANTLTLYGGGIIEVNGALYKVLNNVTFNTSTTINQYVKLTVIDDSYITASLTDNLGIFNYNKNGYYDGTSRVINIYDVLHGIIPTLITGSTVMNLTCGSNGTSILGKGWYRFVISGGRGGNGGRGGTAANSPGISGTSGTSGSPGETLNGIFRLDMPTNITCISGKNGGGGSKGSDTNQGIAGIGGRGGTGGPSRIYGGTINIIALGGVGGSGGTPLKTSSDYAVGTTGANGADNSVSDSAVTNIAIYKIA